MLKAQRYTNHEETLSRMVAQLMSPTYRLTCWQFHQVIVQLRK